MQCLKIVPHDHKKDSKIVTINNNSSSVFKSAANMNYTIYTKIEDRFFNAYMNMLELNKSGQCETQFK
ncbi:hypothetical protein PIROE2DRAFT_14284 [Piromyces sp. E2]|nr:hypothetical protein PIROE2DRAFT_14284 [Piromyces sp. E2]|eukprot:OUM60030.1 hypothetical protein PIROE2DRAFT_14284 [Piromyces sp. E2]